VINNCTLVGRIANDPEMRYTTSGMAVVSFRIAVSRQRKSADGQEETDWLDIKAFGKSAEFVAQYMDKGSLVGVEGRIQSRNWQTNDGQKRYSVEIVANTVQALESKSEADRRRAAKGVSAPSVPTGPGGQAGPSPMPPPAEDYGTVRDDDPFGDQ
jgi:single-strand DNA-binding protein